MKIKEVCERTGLTERTVRFYMQKGLIAPRGEWRNGREYSEFSEPDVEMLQAIATLRELSFSIDEILTMQRTPGAIPSIVEARRDAARLQHETAENAYAVLGRLDPNGVSDVTALAARAREAAAYRPHPAPPPRPAEVNNSGMGDRCNQVPFEIQGKWNWGAFLMPVIWGLANHVYQALWCFVPIIGFFYSFYLGAHGNELAWKHHYWESVEEFRRIQRRWAVGTICVSAAILALNIGIRIASSHAAAKEKALHETRLAAMEAQLHVTPEWEELVSGRVEWTDAMAQECEKELLIQDDAFYLAPEAYYRITYSDYYDSGENENATIKPNGEVVFRDGTASHAVYECSVELSNTERWAFLCEAGADNALHVVQCELDEAATETNRYYIEMRLRAVEEVEAYVAKRTAEVTASALWQEKIGPDYEFTEAPMPGYVSYEKVYEGGDVECGGYSASVRAADGTLWYVHIDMDPEQNAEGPLTIEPVAEE